MKKTITLLAALIGLNSLAPIAASTAESMYKDLVEPIMLTSELPVDKAWKIYDLRNKMKIHKGLLTEEIVNHHLMDNHFYNKVAASIAGWLSLLPLGISINEVYGLYHNLYQYPIRVRNQLIFDSLLFAGLSATSIALYKNTWHIKERKNKINEMSRFIEKLDVILEQLRKDHQKSQTSAKRFPGDPDPSYTWYGRHDDLE